MNTQRPEHALKPKRLLKLDAGRLGGLARFKKIVG
jgi:hypothetical protein